MLTLKPKHLQIQ